jgi:exodeoxyribonuclease VII large subunit
VVETALSGDRHRRPFRVSELAAGLRELLEEEVGRVFVVGEISNLRRAASGHCYFTLKDDQAQLRAALFRSAAVRLPFDPEDGLEVLVEAEVTLYAARGDLQLVVRHMEPRGQGALQLAFEQLRARLEAEGLFDPAKKRPLPAWPRRVGVVTSPSGAALHDVIEVSGRRMPGIPLLLAPARVQGDGAEDELAAALASLGRVADVDVILLVRGGGSLEDLRPFNTERLARAIVASRLPVVSGVGHEVDVTIADLAADARAPTPSAAALLALPDRAEWQGRVHALRRHLVGATRARTARAGRRLAQLAGALRAHAPAARLAARRARLDTLARALEREGAHALALRREKLAAAAAHLDALSPLAVLGRGYAIARAADGRVLRRAREVAPGDTVTVRLHEGEIDGRVTAVRHPEDPGS